MSSVSEYWWVKTPAGEEFGPITTAGLKRLIADGIITSSDEIRQEDCEDYQVMETQTYFSLGTQVSISILKPAEKTEILKTEIEHTILHRKQIEISAIDPSTVESPTSGTEGISESYTLAELTRYEEGRLGRNLFFVFSIVACLALVFYIVQKFSESNRVEFNQASKKAKSQFSGKSSGKSKRSKSR